MSYDGRPISFKTLDEAREHAANTLRNAELAIIQSPHPNNRHGDFFIVEPSPMIRSWELLLFEGKGKDAK